MRVGPHACAFAFERVVCASISTILVDVMFLCWVRLSVILVGAAVGVSPAFHSILLHQIGDTTRGSAEQVRKAMQSEQNKVCTYPKARTNARSGARTHTGTCIHPHTCTRAHKRIQPRCTSHTSTTPEHAYQLLAATSNTQCLTTSITTLTCTHK